MNRTNVDQLIRVSQDFGITSEQAATAAMSIVAAIPKSMNPNEEIALIKTNPGLNMFQKFRLIRSIKKSNK